MDKNGLLYKYHASFCIHFSTDSCLVQLTDFILRDMDKWFHICTNIHKYMYIYYKYMYMYIFTNICIYIYIYIYMIIYKSLNDPGLYLFADDTCIFYQDKDVERIEKVLNK